MQDAEQSLRFLQESARDLARPDDPAADPPERPEICGKASTLVALRAIAGHCIDSIAFHAPFVRRRGGIEDVHRMRVAVRRLRAALSIFRRALGGGKLAFEADLRWLQDRLGAVRDWDVLRQDSIRPVLKGKAGLRGKARAKVGPVDEAGEAARENAYKELCDALESRRCAILWTEIGQWHADPAAALASQRRLDWPARKYARRELRRRARKLRRHGRRIAALEDAELHKLRIGAKKLRYATEFFSDLFPAKATKKTVGRLSDLQDLLGGMNDSRTAQRLLDWLATLAPEAQTAVPVALGAGLVEGAALARSEADRRQLERRWRRYDKARKAWD